MTDDTSDTQLVPPPPPTARYQLGWDAAVAMVRQGSGTPSPDQPPTGPDHLAARASPTWPGLDLGPGQWPGEPGPGQCGGPGQARKRPGPVRWPGPVGGWSGPVGGPVQSEALDRARRWTGPGGGPVQSGCWTGPGGGTGQSGCWTGPRQDRWFIMIARVYHTSAIRRHTDVVCPHVSVKTPHLTCQVTPAHSRSQSRLGAWITERNLLPAAGCPVKTRRKAQSPQPTTSSFLV